MNKKKIKKENNKREIVNKNENMNSLDSSIWEKVFIVLGVVCFLLLFYLLTLYITNKNSTDSEDKNTDTEEVSISYEEIPIGRSLSMSDEEYYVLFYDGSDEDINSTYSELYSNYKNKEDALKIYYVDMSRGINKAFATSEDANYSPDSESDFKINGPTLIKVSGGSVSEYVEGKDSINEYLG